MPQTLIDSQFLTADAEKVTFDSIPQTFDSLKLVFRARSTALGRLRDDVILILNGDTAIGDHYRSNGTAGLSTLATIPTADAPSDRFGHATLEFPAYTLANLNNLCTSHSVNNAGTSGDDRAVQTQSFSVVRFGPTLPIFKIELALDSNDSEFAAGLCRFDLYGVN